MSRFFTEVLNCIAIVACLRKYAKGGDFGTFDARAACLFQSQPAEISYDEPFHATVAHLSDVVRVRAVSQEEEEDGGDLNDHEYPVDCAPHFLALLLERMHPRDFANLVVKEGGLTHRRDKTYGAMNIMMMNIKCRSVAERSRRPDLFWPVIYAWEQTGRYYEDEFYELNRPEPFTGLRSGPIIDRGNVLSEKDFRKNRPVYVKSEERPYFVSFNLFTDDIDPERVRCLLRPTGGLTRFGERNAREIPREEDGDGFGVMMYAKCMAVACCAFNANRCTTSVAKGRVVTRRSNDLPTNVYEYTVRASRILSRTAEVTEPMKRVALASQIVVATNLLDLHAPVVYSDQMYDAKRVDELQSWYVGRNGTVENEIPALKWQQHDEQFYSGDVSTDFINFSMDDYSHVRDFATLDFLGKEELHDIKYYSYQKYKEEVQTRLAEFREIARCCIAACPRALLMFLAELQGLDRAFVNCFDSADSAKLVELFHRKPCDESALPTRAWDCPNLRKFEMENLRPKPLRQ